MSRAGKGLADDAKNLCQEKEEDDAEELNRKKHLNIYDHSTSSSTVASVVNYDRRQFITLRSLIRVQSSASRGPICGI